MSEIPTAAITNKERTLLEIGIGLIHKEITTNPDKNPGITELDLATIVAKLRGYPPQAIAALESATQSNAALNRIIEETKKESK